MRGIGGEGGWREGEDREVGGEEESEGRRERKERRVGKVYVGREQQITRK